MRLGTGGISVDMCLSFASCSTTSERSKSAGALGVASNDWRGNKGPVPSMPRELWHCPAPTRSRPFYSFTLKLALPLFNRRLVSLKLQSPLACTALHQQYADDDLDLTHVLAQADRNPAVLKAQDFLKRHIRRAACSTRVARLVQPKDVARGDCVDGQIRPLRLQSLQSRASFLCARGRVSVRRCTGLSTRESVPGRERDSGSTRIRVRHGRAQAQPMPDKAEETKLTIARGSRLP